MDQVKVILAVLKKQYFWVLCLLLLITSTVVWMMAVGSIKEQSQAHLAKIQATMSEARNVSQIAQHPNQQITEAYNKVTAKLKEQVFQVWDSLYKRQRTTVLKWPKPLGEKFLNFIQSVRFGDEIHVDLRETYQNYVKTRWEELPGIIKAKPLEEDKKGLSGVAASTPMTATPNWIVIWKDQDAIRRQLFSQPNPTKEWVWATQEDLWVYENILNIIKLTNEGALGPHNAVISSIIHMDVGKQAASGAGGTEKRITSSSDSDDFEEEDGGSSGSGGGEGLLSNRYVDEKGVPVPNWETIKNDEYKQVPVRLVLSMDPKEIPQLIVNCANADLPVEIQQVRVNADAGGRDKRVEAPVLSPEDIKAGRKVPHVEVAMQGVIYIFNPPSEEKLKMNATGSSSDPASATEALQGTDGAPVTDAASAFGETPAEGAPAATEDPAESLDGAAEPADGTEPMTDASAPVEQPAAPASGEPMATEPDALESPDPESPDPDAPASETPMAETETEKESPASGSLEDLFEE